MRVETELNLNGAEPFSTPARLRPAPESPGDFTVIHLTGPLTRGERADLFLAEVRNLIRWGQLNLLIDMADVPYIDSAGLAGLAAAYNSARDAQTRVKFLAPTYRVLKSLQSVHLDRVFELFNSEQEAVASF